MVPSLNIFILILIIILSFQEGKLTQEIYGNLPKTVSDQPRLEHRDYVITLMHDDGDLL